MSATAEPSLAASSIVAAPLQEVEQALRCAHRDLTDDLEAIFERLRTVAAAARDAHETAAAVLQAAPVHDPTARREALQRYRSTTVRHVIDPVADALDDLDVGRRLRAQRQALEAVRTGLAASVPETLTREQPDGLFEPTPDDTPGQRLRKQGVRLAQAVHAWARSSGPVQTIPMRKRVAECAAGPLGGAHDNALHAAEQAVARWTATAERTLAAWTHAVLTAEHLLQAAPAPDERMASSIAEMAERVGLMDPADAETEASAETEAPEPTPDVSSEASSGPSPDEADGAADGETPDIRSDRLEPVWTQMAALTDCLASAAALSASSIGDPLNAATTEALKRLREATERAGAVSAPTFARPTRTARRQRTKRRTQAAHWPPWFEQVTERLRFLHTLSALRDAATDAQRQLAAAAHQETISTIHAMLDAGADALRDVHQTVDDVLQAPDAGRERALVRQFERIRDEAIDTLDQHLLHPVHDLAVSRLVRAAVDAHRDDLQAAVVAAPEAFTVHAVPAAEPARVTPDGSPFVIPWREVLHDAFGSTFSDAWDAAVPPLLRDLKHEFDAIDEVRTSLQFNLSAALEELQDHAAARRRGEAAEQHIADARELAMDGLSRCVQTLEALAERLQDAFEPFVEATQQATASAWIGVHDRARAAGGARAQVLRVQSWLTRQAHAVAEAAQHQARRASVVGRRAATRGTRLFNTLVRKGRTAVNATVDDASVRETVEALSTVEGVLDTLPLVYRRLFSFRPVMDPALLMGRDDDLAFVEQHIRHWRGGLNNALVVTGPAGSGRTSFLNVLRDTHLRPGERYTLDLRERIRDEATLARTVAEALAVPLDAPPDTLDAVAEAILAEWKTDAFRVGLVETLEHVYLRTIGGSALTARFLQFLSSTDSRILWIVTCSTAGWQAILTSQPGASALVDHHPLDPLDRDELEALVMKRHRRSGVPITFEPPAESAAPLLARRLRSADADAQQALLRDEYFSQLHALCGQNVMLALAYWFRSLRLEDEHLYIESLRPISFDMLDRFSLQQSFALKALLDHATLTVGELADVAQVAPEDGHALLESLGNALLITPVNSLHAPGVFRFFAIERGVRYRIRPLVIHPVTRHLRSRNIVHG